MKSLILKDLYNIGHNAQSMFLILLVFAVLLIPSSNPVNYIIISGIMCSMMIVTTFVFDDNSKWTRYAMIMPVSKKDLVKSKFAVLFAFCAAGTLIGLILEMIGGLLLHRITVSAESLSTLLLGALIGLSIAEIYGSMSIPLAFKFGSERGRMLLLISFLIPTAIYFGVYKLIILAGVTLTDRLVFILLCCLPFMALLWNYVMYRISYAIFSQQEL